MGGRNHHRPQLVKRHCCKPVFIMAFQYYQHPISRTDVCLPEYICHLIAVYFYIPKGKDMLLLLRVAPDKGCLIRCLLRKHIRHIISKIKICRILKLKALKGTIFPNHFPAIFLIDTHICSLSLHPFHAHAPEPFIPLSHQIRIPGKRSQLSG